MLIMNIEWWIGLSLYIFYDRVDGALRLVDSLLFVHMMLELELMLYGPRVNTMVACTVKMLIHTLSELY